MIDRTQLPNAFEFVTLASARARQLLSGCLPRVAGDAKAARTAQREVLAGAVCKVEPPAPAEAQEVSPEVA